MMYVLCTCLICLIHTFHPSRATAIFFEHPALVSVLLNTVWLGGLHHLLDNTIDVFACLISLTGSAIYSALLEHAHGKYEQIDFSPAKTEEVYQNLWASLLENAVFHNQLCVEGGDHTVWILITFIDRM
jgi:hypothetical protein